MDGEHVERLMDVLLQMRINLRQITESFQLQSQEIRQQLGAIFEDQKKALEDCLDGIDDKIRECSTYVEDYKRMYLSLNVMREKLVQLGAEPSPMPQPSPEEHIEGILVWRLQELKSQGKV
jgi:ABC-type enterochelin transport system substrate-binding protein